MEHFFPLLLLAITIILPLPRKSSGFRAEAVTCRGNLEAIEKTVLETTKPETEIATRSINCDKKGLIWKLKPNTQGKDDACKQFKVLTSQNTCIRKKERQQCNYMIIIRTRIRLDFEQRKLQRCDGKLQHSGRDFPTFDVHLLLENEVI